MNNEKNTIIAEDITINEKLINSKISDEEISEVSGGVDLPVPDLADIVKSALDGEAYGGANIPLVLHTDIKSAIDTDIGI